MAGASLLLTRLDMSKRENVAEAERRLLNCRSSDDLRRWADQEGLALIRAGLSHDLEAQSLQDELDDATNDATASEKVAQDLREAIAEFVSKAEELDVEVYEALPESLRKAIDDLDSARNDT